MAFHIILKNFSFSILLLIYCLVNYDFIRMLVFLILIGCEFVFLNLDFFYQKKHGTKKITFAF